MIHDIAKSMWTPHPYLVLPQTVAPTAGNTQPYKCLSMLYHYLQARTCDTVNKVSTMKTWFPKHGVEELECPDLNPAEHLRDELDC